MNRSDPRGFPALPRPALVADICRRMGADQALILPRCRLPIALLVLWTLASSVLAVVPADNTGATDVEEVVIRAGRLGSSFLQLAGYASLHEDEIDFIAAVHPHEVFARIPGVWISQGSGQEHLIAIRSSVLTGAGACGAFLLLENGVPVRPAGFCNANGLFELNTAQAGAIEVNRGPAGGLYGANAMHGVINVSTRLPGEGYGNLLGVEIGRWDSLTGSLGYEFGDRKRGARIDATATRSDGWRNDSGFDEQKISLSQTLSPGRWDVINTFSITNLEQETAGYVLGYQAYKEPGLRTSNPNPEAYRDAWSWRLTSGWHLAWKPHWRLQINWYARRSEMDFRMHFLPGQPRERNGQYGSGVQLSLQRAERTLRAHWGLQTEWWRGFLSQEQDGPTQGSAFLVATRPPGQHYDYDVNGLTLSLYQDLDWRPHPNWSLFNALRLQRIGYDYDNHLPDGNLRDDGRACGFGGCLYTRPADRDDSFVVLAGRLGTRYQPLPGVWIYGLVGIGFRPPQATELYRLQNGQEVVDLQPETLVNFELGLTLQRGAWHSGLALFRQRKEDVILQDANRYNISHGKTAGYGAELNLSGRIGKKHNIGLAVSWARHSYDFECPSTECREPIRNGDELDTAPEWTLNGHWKYSPINRLHVEIEVVYQGEYQLNASNTAEYGGHSLMNLRVAYAWNRNWQIRARVMNLTNHAYAHRADFAFNEYRYFPGHPRRLFVSVERSLR